MNRYRTILLVSLIIAFGAMSIIGGNAVCAGAQPTLAVHVDHSLGAISPNLRGANQRYPDCGSYAWDCTTNAPVAAVVTGAMPGWHSQPYTTIKIDSVLYHITSLQQKYHLTAAAFNRDHGLLYILEPLADEDWPLVHVVAGKSRVGC